MEQEYDWPADAYAIGSFIQKTIADRYFSSVKISANAHVLDIGCGNGAYSRNILAQVPNGVVVGLDTSEAMLKLAEQVKKEYPQFQLQLGNVQSLGDSQRFDWVTSFWCLQWTKDIREAFSHMAKALKTGGQLFTLFPSGTDPFITTYYTLRDSGLYPQLQDFKPPMSYDNLDNLQEKLKDLPFKKLNIQQINTSLTLPDLSTFRNFVQGIAFYQGQMTAHEVEILNDAMVENYDRYCQTHYAGQYLFECGIYLVSGEK